MDEIFKKPIEKQFEFDEKIASVFDDMLDRSIPFYKEVISFVCDGLFVEWPKMRRLPIAERLLQFARPGKSEFEGALIRIPVNAF